MNRLLALSRFIDDINRHISKIACWLVLISCLVSAGNALVRYGINQSSNAWLEIQWYMFAAMFMLGAAYTLAKNEHVRVDIFYARLSTRGQIWVDLIGGLLFLLPAAAILTWLSWPVFYKVWVSGEMSSSAGGLIRWPVKIFLPLGFGLLVLQGVSEVIKRAAMLTGHLEANLHYERPLQ
jgi:TRAP-type mannitol/chloroaromatic compound transport system permease small subunit